MVFDGRRRDNGGVSSSIKCNLHFDVNILLSVYFYFGFWFDFSCIFFVFSWLVLFLKKLVVVVE